MEVTTTFNRLQLSIECGEHEGETVKPIEHYDDYDPFYVDENGVIVFDREMFMCGDQYDAPHDCSDSWTVIIGEARASSETNTLTVKVVEEEEPLPPGSYTVKVVDFQTRDGKSEATFAPSDGNG